MNADAGDLPNRHRLARMDWSRVDAILFDLDGVITPTAVIHRRAWGDMFEEFLATCPGAAPWSDADYYELVDGRPRFDGVRRVLESRGIALPEGNPDDPPEARTVYGLGNRKNAEFVRILARDGIDPYPGSVRLLDALAPLPLRLAVVSSSRNAVDILRAARVLDRFQLVVDGVVAGQLGLAGKPAPDTFLHAARVLGVEPGRAAVVEDATSGVAAGRAGGFGLVLGVDRGAGHRALLDSGADVVVNDLAEVLA